MKKAFAKTVLLLFVLIYALTPFCASAFSNDVLFNGIGNDFVSFITHRKGIDSRLTPIETDEFNPVETDETSAVILLNKKYMSLKVEQYNIVLKTWMPVEHIHEGYTVRLENLKPGTFYKIRLSCLDKASSEYSFFTCPESVKNLKLDIGEDKNIKIKWKNPNHLLTEVFKKRDNEPLVKYIGATRSDEYIDEDIQKGSEYTYKLRMVSKNTEAVSFSSFKGVSTFIEEDISDEILSHGYIVIKQTDENNRTIPYPYNGNGKTIGTSGCGVCSSLMVIRNTSKYEPKLEAYTNELLKVGARESYGSNMFKIADYMKKEYHFSYRATKDVNELKAHLDKGYMATAHVGTYSYFTTGTGHFVTVAGYVKGVKQDRVVILDPGFSVRKYNELSRVSADIEIVGDGIVSAPFETLLKDCKGEYFMLFTPEE
ncbi:MAG: C39 family peptidase [Eubacterium sp.]|nr:C39 family peptidase [Eubacterium sp.]